MRVARVVLPEEWWGSWIVSALVVMVGLLVLVLVCSWGWEDCVVVGKALVLSPFPRPVTLLLPPLLFLVLFRFQKQSKFRRSRRLRRFSSSQADKASEVVPTYIGGRDESTIFILSANARTVSGSYDDRI